MELTARHSCFGARQMSGTGATSTSHFVPRSSCSVFNDICGPRHMNVRRRIQANDEGWDMAWIGMYRSYPAGVAHRFSAGAFRVVSASDWNWWALLVPRTLAMHGIRPWHCVELGPGGSYVSGFAMHDSWAGRRRLARPLDLVLQCWPNNSQSCRSHLI